MLLAEYAIEPQSLSTWDRFRYIADMCGVSTGRLISNFPNNWCGAVRDSAVDMSTLTKTRFIEKLKHLKQNALIDLGRNYDTSRSWQENTLVEHQRMEFKAIIADRPDSPEMLDISLLDTSDAAWNVANEEAVPRTADDLALVAAFLLCMARQVIFVDPYFSAEDRRCRRPLIKFLEHAQYPLSRMEFHLCSRNSGSQEHFLDMLNSRLLLDLRRWGGLPADQKFFFIRWNELPNGDGEAIHPRYILTDKGGMRFEHGLAEENENERTDVSLLDQGLYQYRLSQYNPASTCFEFVDGWCIQSGQISRVTIENGEWARA